MKDEEHNAEKAADTTRNPQQRILPWVAVSLLILAWATFGATPNLFVSFGFPCLLIATITGSMSHHLAGWLAALFAFGTLLVLGIAALTLDD